MQLPWRRNLLDLLEVNCSHEIAENIQNVIYAFFPNP
jgi:hypothetical protein